MRFFICLVALVFLAISALYGLMFAKPGSEMALAVAGAALSFIIGLIATEEDF